LSASVLELLLSLLSALVVTPEGVGALGWCEGAGGAN